MRLARFLAALLIPAALLIAGPAHARVEGGADCAGASASDVNGDGIDDVVAGDPYADVGGAAGAGTVTVLLRGDKDAALVLHAPSPAAGDGFGWSVRTAHIDGDRCLDVVVGAPYADGPAGAGSGAVYVFYGGPGDQPRVVELRPAKGQRDGHFGWSLAAAEETSGTVVAVGEPHADQPGVKDAGAVHLFQFPPGATSGDGAARRLAVITQDSEGVIGNSEPGDMYGWALALGHLGGTADRLDLAVGVPYENDDGVGRQVASGRIDAGMVGVVFDVSASHGVYTSAKWDLRQATTAVKESTGDRFGYALAYAEWKGNGYLAAVAPLADAGGRDTGLVQVFTRIGGGELRPSRALSPVAAWSLAWWNAPSGPALAVGCPYASTPEERREAGVVRVFTLEGRTGDPVMTGAAEGDHLGASLASGGGDGGLAPGRLLIAGVPDRGATGGVALLGESDPADLGPAPEERPLSAEFGASVAG